MFWISIDSDSVTPNLEKKIEQQRHYGGRLIAYQRFWAALVVAVYYVRIEHVHPHSSRKLAGIKHSLFTLALGIWSVPTLFFGVPIVIFRNTLGGVDVTEFYSDSLNGRIRQQPPLQGTAASEDRFAGLMVLSLLLVVLIVILCVFYFH